MRASQDPLYRLACRVHRMLRRPIDERAELLEQQLSYFSDLCRRASVSCRHHAIARERHWQFAALKSRHGLLDGALRLHQITREIVNTPDRPPRFSVPSISLLWAELRQLQNEFDHFQIDDQENSTISVQTDPITLEDVELGPFSIVLELSKLVGQRDSSCFQCVALDPHPAERNSSITHPHVMEGKLCAGDASMPIVRALSDGRICDAFLLVRSVLNTYNPASPYAKLEEWDGITCPDCQANASEEDLYRCPDCGRRVCDGCMSPCDVCDRSCCRSCQEHDEESHRWCCATCRRHCRGCDRVVDSESFDDESELCPQCLAQRQPLPQPPPPPALILVCECNSSSGYPDQVYAIVELNPERACELLALRGAMGSVASLLSDRGPATFEVRDTRLRYTTGFGGDYQDGYLEHNLTSWHVVAVDPPPAESEVLVDGQTLLVSSQGVRWRANPSHDGFQLIETPLLGWVQLESVAAGHTPFALMPPDCPIVTPEASVPAVTAA